MKEKKSYILPALMSVLFLVLLLVIILFSVSAYKSNKAKRAEIAKGISFLSQTETVNAADVENRIREKKNEQVRQNEEWKNRPLNVKFEDSLIVGDSHAESLVGYHILDASEVIAKKGESLMNFSDYSNTIINLNPQNIFLTYGMNDMGVFNSCEDFIDKYERVIQTLQESLPDTTIYVTLVFNCLPEGLLTDSYLSQTEEYNAAIIAMCERLHITYIDSNPFLTNDSYDNDGIHMTKEFYIQWAEYMADASGI